MKNNSDDFGMEKFWLKVQIDSGRKELFLITFFNYITIQ